MKCSLHGAKPKSKFYHGCEHSSAIPGSMQPTSDSSPARKSTFKEWLRCAVISVIAIAVVIMFNGCDIDGDTPVKETGGVTEAKTEAQTSVPGNETYGLNDTAIFENIKVTANEIEESAGKDFFKPDSGKVFLGVKFTIENTSNEEQNISSMLLFEAYVDGVKCDYSFNAQCAFPDGNLDGTLTPGKKMVGYYAVEVPASWAEFELQVKGSWLSASNAAFIFKK